jgi:hypothetical protein
VKNLTIESIAAGWDKVTDFSEGATNPESAQEMIGVVMLNAEKKREKEEEAAKNVAAAAPAKPKSGLISEQIFAMM